MRGSGGVPGVCWRMPGAPRAPGEGEGALGGGVGGVLRRCWRRRRGSQPALETGADLHSRHGPHRTTDSGQRTTDSLSTVPMESTLGGLHVLKMELGGNLSASYSLPLPNGSIRCPPGPPSFSRALELTGSWRFVVGWMDVGAPRAGGGYRSGGLPSRASAGFVTCGSRLWRAGIGPSRSSIHFHRP